MLECLPLWRLCLSRLRLCLDSRSLEDEGKRCKSKVGTELNCILLKAVSAIIKCHKTTDPDEIAELAKLPVTSVTRALEKLNALAS